MRFDKILPWLLLALIPSAFFFDLGRGDIVTSNEGQRAAPPAEMLRSGAYVIPTINGQDYLKKPPLLYWVIAGAYRASGVVSPLSARLPTALCGLILVLACYGLSRRAIGGPAAVWAAFGIGTSFYVLERSRLAQLDIPLTLAVFLCIMALYAAWQAPSRARTAGLAILAGVALAAGILLKGPVPLLFVWAAWVAHSVVASGAPHRILEPGIRLTGAAFAVALAIHAVESFGLGVLPFPAALALYACALSFLALRHGGPRSARRALGLALCLATGLALSAPWAAAVVALKGWPYVQDLLHAESLERTYSASAINSGSPLYYILALPLLLPPWGTLFPLACSPKRWRQRGELYRFSALCFGVSVLLFSFIAGKEYEYVLPAFPFLFLCIGADIARMARRVPGDAQPRWERTWLAAMGGLLIVAPVGAALYISLDQPSLSLALRVWTMAAVAAGALLGTWRRPNRRMVCLALAALLTCQMVFSSRAHLYSGKNSYQNVALTAGALSRQGRLVEAAEIRPAFAFYTGAEIPIERDSERLAEKFNGEAPYYYVLGGREYAKISELGLRQAPQVLQGPDRKGTVLLGNAPLPPGVSGAVPGVENFEALLAQ